ncbi:MAG: DNA mismatch repair protein MutS [Brevinematales bacterium]|nr:DNA mismatch repair protein MutS [Brevinematales bacterium]
MNDLDSLTPMMRQYKEIKARHPDKILLFRVGDFYEMFYEDAKVASQILSIALTSRNDMPMAGFPFHAAQHYIQKLVKNNQKVAICEQLEDPSKAKKLVKRDIVEIITPATRLSPDLSVEVFNQYLAVLYHEGSEYFLWMADISTGDMYGHIFSGSPSDVLRAIQDEWMRYQPLECLYREELHSWKAWTNFLSQTGVLAQSMPVWYFDEGYFPREVFATLEKRVSKKGALKGLAGVFRYFEETQVGNPHLKRNFSRLVERIQLVESALYVEMDDFTIRNLELTSNLWDGSIRHTLFEVLNETMTPMGTRLLKRWILYPLARIPMIEKRLNDVEHFVRESVITSQIRTTLRSITDIERLHTRLELGKVIPRDLIQLKQSLRGVLSLLPYITIEGYSQDEARVSIEAMISLLEEALNDDPPSTFQGEVIREGYHQDLDDLRRLLREGRDFILKLQERERERTKIASLKVRYNNVFGYFIEVSKANLHLVPPDYIRKQSLVNAERYTLPELEEYEAKVATASERIAKLEEELFHQVVEKVLTHTALLSEIASKVAYLDVVTTLAFVAVDRHYTRPVLSDKKILRIVDGRHPVVEHSLGRNLFVPNDTIMDENDFLVILTGPNMAGKSTYLRQNALIVLMAQMGSFVPAREAHIGVVDKIFTRIGASDNLSQGLSTFLVEMQEAARILTYATPKSLIIMDELGRGTSTYDGLSIAWAVIEYLADHPEKKARTLFATHYHELTQLGEKPGIKNYTVAVREQNDDLVFLRKVIPGPADKSYGIHVARLAGIPMEVIERARTILETLEKEGVKTQVEVETEFSRRYHGQVGKQDFLFEESTAASYDWLAKEIKKLDLNQMTPIDALNFLVRMKQRLG